MASDVSICSNALLALGDKPISSFDEATQIGGLDRARLCANLYPQVRNNLLRRLQPNCAKARVILAPDSIAPAFDYTNRFLLPGDFLRIVSIGQKDDADDYQLEGRYILANVSTLYLRYVYQNENVASWDSMLVSAMELAMKAVLAYPITKSTAEKDSCKQELEMYLRQYRAIDGQDIPPETLGDFPLLNARYNG